MSRDLRNLFFFLVGLLLSSLCVMAYAESIPATAETNAIRWVYKSGSLPNWRDSPQVACEDHIAYQNTHQTTYVYSNPSGSDGEQFAYCSYHLRYASGADYGDSYTTMSHSQSCLPDNSPITSTTQCLAYKCPSTGNWMLDGQTCTRPDCGPNETRQPDGTCVNKCASMAGQSNSYWTGQTYCDKGSLVSAPSSICENGCVMQLGGWGVGTSTYWCQTVGKYTGATCNANSPVGSGGVTGDVDDGGTKIAPNTPAKNCIDQGKAFGTVNGTVVCVDPTTATGSKSTSTTNTDPAGNTTSSSSSNTTTTTTTNPDGSVTVVVVTTNSDGSKTTTTTTTPKGGEGAGGGGGGNGTGEPAFTSPKAGSFKGKAEDIAAAQQAISEKLTQVKNEAKTLLGSMTTGQGSLPCDSGVNVAGGTFSLCVSKYTENLKAIPAAIVLLGALTAVFIIFR